MSTDDRFDRFDESIQLSVTERERVEGALGRLTEHLLGQYEISEGDIFTQGSFANGTVIRPIKDRDFDVDVVVVCAKENEAPGRALDQLDSALSESADYDKRILDSKQTPSCVRLQYADNFHVDVVPARPATDAPLEVPKRDHGWHGTAPAEYAAWCREQGASFLQTVRMMKRWRDNHQTARAAVKSITFQVLIWNCLEETDTPANRILRTFQSIQALLDDCPHGPPRTENPVLTSEDLAAGWQVEDYKKFREEIDEAVALAGAAVESGKTEDWRRLFGDAFPPKAVKAGMIRVAEPKKIRVLPPKKVRIAPPGYPLGNTSHYLRLHEQRKLHRKSAVRKIAITHEVFLQDGNGQAGAKDSAWRLGQPVPHTRYIKYTATVPHAQFGRIWWQVVNTGKHAEDKECLRGGVKRTDSTVHWEPTAYHGKHWVECYYVTRDGFIVAESGRYYVDIYHPDYA